MVHFVLDTAGKQSSAGEHVGVAARILELDGDFVGAYHVATNLRKWKTSFLINRFRLGHDRHLGISERERHEKFQGGLRAVEFPVEFTFYRPQVHDAKLNCFSDLLSC